MTIARTNGLQAALDAKQATVTGAATTIVSDDLTGSRALTSNGSGKVAVSDVTSTELSVLDGITSTTSELNILDGVTATTADLTYLMELQLLLPSLILWMVLQPLLLR